MVVTGNHIERWVGAYNAYRAWEKLPPAAQAALEDAAVSAADKRFVGEHVSVREALPITAETHRVYFVGDWSSRDGTFVRFDGARWVDER